MSWPDQATWQFINTFAGWISGTGSLLAVLVALHLARQDRRVCVEVSANIMTAIGPMKPPRESIGIRLANPNRRVAQISLIGWINTLKKPIVLQTFTADTQFPVRLADGDEVVLSIPFEYMRLNLKSLMPLLTPCPRLMIHFLRVVAFPTVGEIFTAKPNPKLRTWILHNIQ